MKRIAVFLLLLSVSTATAEKTFRFTAIPDQDTARLQERFDAIAAYLSDKLGVDAQYIPVKSYAASVQAFKNDEVQLAWFGGLSGVKARRAVSGSKAIAQGEEDLAFVSYFIAHSSTGLKESKQFPQGIRGKTFTFGSKGSTSGRLMPEFYLRKHLGGAPSEVFERHGFSGDHSKTIALVQSGAWQVGALNYKVWETELKEGKIDTDKVSIIWRTPTYPDYNWSIRGDVEGKYGKGFIDRVQQALLKMEDRNLLDRFPRSKFVPADNSMYGPILTTGTAIGLFEN